MAREAGYDVPKNEKKSLEIMLAADDFRIGEFIN
jgi:hypothetical protein